MEQHGYDVSYISNIDTHADPKGLLRAKGFISVGHDEYWSLDMYDNVMKARDEGVSLAFFGGNSVLCVVPMLSSSDGTPNRAVRREGWFLPVPENIPEAARQRLLKRMVNQEGFEPNMGPDGAQLMGGRLDNQRISTLAPFSPKLVWGEGLGVRGQSRVFESESRMNSSEYSKRRSARDPEHIAFARDQRARANEFAQDVWQMVRGRRCRNQKFRRESPIPTYTADFCWVALKLIVEIDGEHHQTHEGKTYDVARDMFPAEPGYEVLRIPGYHVTQDPAAVRRQIESAIDDRMDAFVSPSPSPSTS